MSYQMDVEDEEHTFNLVCEYLPDDIVEQCQQKLKLHGNVQYDTCISSSTNDQDVSKTVIEYVFIFVFHE